MGLTRVIHAVVLLAGASVLGLFTLLAIGEGVWGARVTTFHFVALLGALLLFVAGLLRLSGRAIASHRMAIIAVLALATWWIPVAVGVVTLYRRGYPSAALFTLGPVALFLAIAVFAARQFLGSLGKRGLSRTLPPRVST
jgi:hypothetical protein